GTSRHRRQRRPRRRDASRLRGARREPPRHQRGARLPRSRRQGLRGVGALHRSVRLRRVLEVEAMAKYLLKASYTAEGAKGVLKDGGTKRREAAQKAIESVGGSVDAFYFAFGSNDAYVLIDMPDYASAAAA